MTVNKNLDSQQYKQTLSSILPTQYELGSLADRLLTQGREEGREEGLEIGALEGKIQMLQEILEEPVTPSARLLELTCDALALRLAELQQRLRDRAAQ